MLGNAISRVRPRQDHLARADPRGPATTSSPTALTAARLRSAARWRPLTSRWPGSLTGSPRPDTGGKDRDRDRAGTYASHRLLSIAKSSLGRRQLGEVNIGITKAARS